MHAAVRICAFLFAAAWLCAAPAAIAEDDVIDANRLAIRRWFFTWCVGGPTGPTDAASMQAIDPLCFREAAAYEERADRIVRDKDAALKFFKYVSEVCRELNSRRAKRAVDKGHCSLRDRAMTESELNLPAIWEQHGETAAEQARARLNAMFPPSSLSSAAADYLSSIGCKCSESRDEYTCHYEHFEFGYDDNRYGYGNMHWEILISRNRDDGGISAIDVTLQSYHM